MFEVRTLTLFDGWINCWTTESQRGTEPTVFDTREEAQASLDEFLEDVRQDYLAGNTEGPYDPEDFRIVQIEDNEYGHTN